MALEEVRVLLDQKTGPQVASALFIAEHHEQDVAGRDETFRFGTEQGGQHHGHAALHVQGTVAPNEPFGHFTGEGRIAPGLVFGGHHIHMAAHEERGCSAASGQTGHQVGLTGLFGEYLGLD